jgi:CRISPR-associated protein Cas6
MPSGQLSTDAHRVIDCAFPLRGDRIPLDHGYALYAALCGLSAAGHWLHASEQAAIQLIRGRYAAPGLLQLTDKSRLRLRLAAADLPNILSLASQSVSVDGHALTIGVPQTTLLRPAVALYAHVVTTRNGDDEARFDAEIARQLETLGIRATLTRGKRRVFRVKDKTVVGHSLLVNELGADDSLRLQALGLGGRRKMGCGVFIPWRG